MVAVPFLLRSVDIPTSLVRDDVFLPGLQRLRFLDLGTLVQDLLGIIVNDDTQTHILRKLNYVIENLEVGK